MRTTHYLMTGALGAALIMTGCKKTGSAPAESQLLSSATMKAQVLENQVKFPDVDNENAKAALNFLKEEGVSWESVTGDKGHYKFEEVTFEDEGATIEYLEVSGLQLHEKEIPYIRSISMQGLTSDDVDIESMTFTLPSFEHMKALSTLEDEADEAKVIQQFSKISTELLSEFGKYSGGGYVEGLTIKDESSGQSENLGGIEFIGWSKTDGTMSMLLEDMNFKMDESDGNGIARVGHMSISNIKVAEGSRDANTDGMGALMGAYMNVVNPYKRGYESMAMRDIEFSGTDNNVGFSLTMPRGDVWFTKPKNEVFHLKADIPEMVVKFDIPENMGAVTEEQLAMIKDNGFDRMEFRYWSDTRIDPKNDNIKLLTGGLGWADNFEIDMRYDMDGMSEYYDNMETMFDKLIPLLSEGGDPAELEAQMDAALEADMLAMMENVVVHEMVMELRDQSLIDKGFQIAADLQGQEISDLKNMAKAFMTMGSAQAPTEYMSGLAKDMTGAIQSLIDDGGTVRLSSRPKNGLSMKELLAGMENVEAENADPAATMEIFDKMLDDLNIDFEHVPN